MVDRLKILSNFDDDDGDDNDFNDDDNGDNNDDPLQIKNSGRDRNETSSGGPTSNLTSATLTREAILGLIRGLFINNAID